MKKMKIYTHTHKHTYAILITFNQFFHFNKFFVFDFWSRDFRLFDWLSGQLFISFFYFISHFSKKEQKKNKTKPKQNNNWKVIFDKEPKRKRKKLFGKERCGYLQNKNKKTTTIKERK